MVDDGTTTIEVFADVGCPFAHVGLRRLVDRRHELGRDDVVLRVRAWPLEVVNGRPWDARFIAEEVDEIREQAAGDLFVDFREEAFPRSTLPAMALAAAGYRTSSRTGEAVSLAVRDALFEQGRPIGDPDVLDAIADAHGVRVTADDAAAVLSDHEDGGRRGVVGSPFFLTGTGGFFCPALDVARDDDGHLRIHADPEGFGAFLDACFA